MKSSELLIKYFDAVLESAVNLELENSKYQVDLYLYPDGTIDTFVNIGGNSWLNDDHIKVYSVNHEYFDNDEEYENPEEWLVCEIAENVSNYLDDLIAQLEYEEEYL